MAIVNTQQIFLIWTFTSTVLLTGCIVLSEEYNCSEVKCPSLSLLDCPADSHTREFIKESNEITTNDLDAIDEDTFNNCCMIKKCTCKLCWRPSCHNATQVLMETKRETNIPGNCCGEYNCTLEPNCKDVFSTNGLGWLIDCQRCECVAGQKICHRSCDEIGLPPANCIGQNKKIYSNGQTWKENECTQCECINGEKKCQSSVCKPLSCQNKIKLPGECCAFCANEPPSNLNNDTKLMQLNSSSSEVVLPSQDTSTVKLPTSSAQPIATTKSPLLIIPPCLMTTTAETPETYSIHTDYVNVIQTSKENCILYGIIAALSIVCAVFIALYCYEKAKQRSYRPVASLDDNCNKIKIKLVDY